MNNFLMCSFYIYFFLLIVPVSFKLLVSVLSFLFLSFMTEASFRCQGRLDYLLIFKWSGMKKLIVNLGRVSWTSRL